MRLIDADALIKSLKKDWPQTSKITWAQIVAKCAPTIDIVRCKDCKHRHEYECPMYHEEWSVTDVTGEKGESHDKRRSG